MVKRFFVLRRTVVKKQKFKMFSLAFFWKNVLLKVLRVEKSGLEKPIRESDAKNTNPWIWRI